MNMSVKLLLRYLPNNVPCLAGSHKVLDNLLANNFE